MNNVSMGNKATKFGKLCRAYRAKMGLTMSQIAEKTKKKQSTITKIEQGNYPLSFGYIKASIDAYGIKNKVDQMEFLLSCLNSTDRFEIPIKEIGFLRKEWLAALLIYGNVKMQNPEGWSELICWMKDFSTKLGNKEPPYLTIGDDVSL